VDAGLLERFRGDGRYLEICGLLGYEV
jgi:hypothetical protein